MHYVPPQLGLITTVVIALIPGIALFLLLPSWVFTYFENWPYSISLYYSYVTTTTIGFGDYVPTFGANQVSCPQICLTSRLRVTIVYLKFAISPRSSAAGSWSIRSL